MTSLQDFVRISDYEWELGSHVHPGRRAPVRFFATQGLLENACNDLSIEQAANAAMLPGAAGVMVMPDVHQGYGLPIGGVLATRAPDGVISPGSIGYDINCGVRVLGSSIDYEEAKPYLDRLATALNQHCPSGVGAGGGLRLTDDELDQVCRDGSRWALKRGMASQQDLRHTEEDGRLEGASSAAISARARERGRSQLGTLGAGNHFIEVQVVDQVFEPGAAQAMGLQEGSLCLSIHCGSRGFGHQVCTDFVQSFQGAARRYGIELPDRELVCAPIHSPDGEAYLGAMRAAANYAFANRQVISHLARQAFDEALAGHIRNRHLHLVYDITHNIAKIETHPVGGKEEKLCIHRKGATRAYGPGAPGLPDEYSAFGQPVLVPGSMGTASWVLVGTSTAMQRSFGSSCHGAGRVMSRSKAKHQVRGETLKQDLEKEGIHVRAGSMGGLAEEAPEAYKDVDQVIEAVCGAGIARKVVRLRPVVVVKG